MRTYPRSLTATAKPGVLFAAAAAFTVGVFPIIEDAFAHDEDWRKLVGRQGMYTGPAFINGEYQNADGTTATAPASFGVTDNANVTLLAQLPLNQFSGGSSSGNDCWGYVSPSGREYAIMGLQRGYGFVEITNPSSPVIIGVINGPSSSWHDIKIIGTHAYGVSEAGSGIQVIDISNIDNGVVTLVQNKVQAGHSSTHNIVANPDSGYLYLVGANISNGGLIAVDTNANPADPTIAGSWTGHYVHDAQVVSYSTGPYAGREIAFCCNESRIDIVDVTNKSNMFTVGTVSYSGASYTHQGWLSEDRQYFYSNDELDENNGVVSTTTTRIFDVSDINNPTFVGTFTSGETSIDHNNYVHNGYLYQANYTSGLQVFDLCNPVAPQRIANYDTNASSSFSFNGAWSVYPFFPSGTVIISDINAGLFIFDVQESSLPSGTIVNGPTQLDPNTPETITAEAESCNSAITAVTLNVSIDGGTPTQSAMSLVSGNTYEGTIPGAPCFSEVTYWIDVTNAGGGTTSSPSITADVFTGINVVFNDNFQTNMGWAEVNLGASSGDWQRGVPVNDPNWDYDPESDSDGSGSCYLTQNQNGNTDVDDGSVQLTSPTLDMSAPGVELSYDYFLNMTDASTDRLRVEANNNNGTGTWTVVVDHNTSGGLSWRNHIITADDLTSAGVTPTATMKFRFTANDSNPQSIIEAALDAIKIQSVQCETSCYADCDGNGTLNVFDYICFGNAYAANDPYADCDGNGSFNVFDYICFGNAYAAGCP